MQETDSPTATVQLAYAPLNRVGSADLDQLTVLAERLPLGAGSFTWNVGDVPTGTYALVVSANDQQSAIVEVAATTKIKVEHCQQHCSSYAMPMAGWSMGGSNGIRSVDGRRMPEDYAWSFQTNGGRRVYLPLVVR